MLHVCIHCRIMTIIVKFKSAMIKLGKILISRAYPDLEKGHRFIRDIFLEISKSNIPKLCQCIKKLI